MSDETMAVPEPKEIDETRSMELRHLSGNAGLRGQHAREVGRTCGYHVRVDATTKARERRLPAR